MVLDADTGREVAALPIPAGVDDVFFDAKRKRVYVTCGEGFLLVFQQAGTDRYEAVAKIPTAKLAQTCLFVPESGRLYLAVPQPEGIFESGVADRKRSGYSKRRGWEEGRRPDNPTEHFMSRSKTVRQPSSTTGWNLAWTSISR